MLFFASLIVVVTTRVDPAVGAACCDVLIFIGGFMFLQHGVLTVIPQDVTSWGEFVQEVPRSSQEFKMQADWVERQAEKHRRHYKHGVSIARMYRVYPKLACRTEGEDEAVLFLQDADPGGINAFRLFHGTSYGNAEAIVDGGYRLPVHAGMFGKGVYFADSPQKSMQYSQSFFGRRKLLLLNRVELGQPKFMKMGARDETGYDPSSRRRWEKFVPTMGGIKRPSNAYDSVVAVTKDRGGSVQVPEYIIYDPRQAIVEYILEVEAA